MKISTESAEICRALSGNPNIKLEILYPIEPNGHKFSVGQTCILWDLRDFPEFNGKEVKIIAIRLDGDRGKAYYIEGEINKFINWVYEYRLKEKE